MDRKYQGQELGGILFADALNRALRAWVGVFAMLVDAKNEAVARLHEHHGFTLLPGGQRRLCLPFADALRHLAGH